MPQKNHQPGNHQINPAARFKIVFVAVCAILGGIVAGGYAPALLESLYTGIQRVPGIKANTIHAPMTAPRPKATPQKAPTANGPKPMGPEVGESRALVPLASAADDQKALSQESSSSGDTYPAAHSFWSILPVALLGALLAAFLGSKILDILSGLVDRWNKMDIGDKVTAVLGVIAGLLMSMPFLVIFQYLQISAGYIPWIVLVLTLGSITLSIYILQSISEFFPWNRGRGPVKRTGIKLLDTNVIIDGRIYDVASNGFLEGQIYVPQFVLEELQHIADHHDPLRRQRGKRGLEVLKHMQADFPLEVGTQDRLAPDNGDPVDSRLVRLARALGADLVTNDHNLNRVAALQEVKVLNLNDLALALRPNVLPQESLTIKIIREGNQNGQGVGYLDDGTMVVVENGQAHINEVVDVEVTQVIQTERGKMIFAEVDRDEELAADHGAKKKPNGAKRY